MARERARKSYANRKAANHASLLEARRATSAKRKAKDPEKFLAARREALAKRRAKDLDKHRRYDAERARKYRAANPDAHKKHIAAWRMKNPDAVKAAGRRAWRKTVSTTAGALRARVSSLVRMSLRRGAKSKSINDTLGFTIEELRLHLERQFLPGMSWGNMGEWHIDHIVPLSYFKITSDTCDEFRRAWHITNLRPLWGSDNVRKGNRITHLI